MNIAIIGVGNVSGQPGQAAAALAPFSHLQRPIWVHYT